MTALHARLKNLRLLEHGDARFLDDLLATVSDRPAGEIVQPEGGPVRTTRILFEGWAVRYQTTPDGERQVLNFLLPGDTVGLYGALCETSDSGVELITDARLAEFPCGRLFNTFRESARLAVALCWIGGQDERFLEQQILRLGLLDATERIAHLLVELQRRFINAGATPAEAMALPLTQKLLAEALGLSAVHVNRCCRDLEDAGLIETAPGALTLLESERLMQRCGYDADSTRIGAIPSASRRRIEGD